MLQSRSVIFNDISCNRCFFHLRFFSQHNICHPIQPRLLLLFSIKRLRESSKLLLPDLYFEYDLIELLHHLDLRIICEVQHWVVQFQPFDDLVDLSCIFGLVIKSAFSASDERGWAYWSITSCICSSSYFF